MPNTSSRYSTRSSSRRAAYSPPEDDAMFGTASVEARAAARTRGSPPLARSTAYGGRDLRPPQGISGYLSRAAPARILDAAVATSQERTRASVVPATAAAAATAATAATEKAGSVAAKQESLSSPSSDDMAFTDESPLGDDDGDEEGGEEQDSFSDERSFDEASGSDSSGVSMSPPARPKLQNQQAGETLIHRFSTSMKRIGRKVMSAWKIILPVIFSILLLSSIQQSRIPSFPFSPLGISPITDLLDRVSSAARATNNLTNQTLFHGISPWQLDRLASRVTQLESSLTSLSRTVQQKPALRKVNFFAAGSGVIVDPYLTSPTRILQYSQAARITAPRSYMDLLRGRSSYLLPRTGPGPAAVFTAWDDAGECWCSAQGGGRAQVAMLLPQLVVPQQLVVEHIPESATLDASSMPRAVELWVQVDDPGARAQVARAAREVVPDHHAVPDGDTSPNTWERQGATTRSELVGDDRTGNRNDAAAAAAAERAKIEFATSRALDETWVRVGRWPFDRTSGEAAQAFDVPVRLDQLAVPVSHVAVRVTASWGDGDDANVCIYRLRLHGLVANELPVQRRR